ncbi:hypothetical protein [Kribbella sp. CA-293567]|uniref:hypothetical protein n=1 Tax=Kribbella sp. CA-293567 TaxID=3002436 RepID=UPI0022DD1DCA|nr:hypothetical protein [Kribbella sp. CA-293567]WBQ07841.1 hypothetical protein OX958_13820 [Kribbella sp. CA-293567]
MLGYLKSRLRLLWDEAVGAAGGVGGTSVVVVRAARESLVVVVGGEETSGLIVYGLSPRGSRRPEFPFGVWDVAGEVAEFTLVGGTWEVPMWEVPVSVWPVKDQFEGAVRATFEAVIAGGCRVAWIGAEGMPFCDPPLLFEPACMSGGVLAWMTDDGAFGCPMDPDLPIAAADDECLRMLRRHSYGLADAED